MNDIRQKHTRDYTSNSVTIGADTFRFNDLPDAQRQHFGLEGLARFLMGQDSPAQAFADLRSGERSMIRVPKQAPRDPWREAAANVHVEMSLRARGVRALPGKKLRDTPDFLAAIVEARVVVDGWSKAQLATAKAHPDVVAEHARLTGGAASLASLFEAPVAPQSPQELRDEMSAEEEQEAEETRSEDGQLAAD